MSKPIFVTFGEKKVEEEFESLKEGKYQQKEIYNLPNAWRLVYTIKEDEIRILSIILEWFNHKDYEKKFNY